MWWWTRLRWTINELEMEQTREVVTAQHNHWVTIASHSRLTDESFEKAKSHASASFNRLLKLTYPWLADKIGEDGEKTDRDDAVDAYQERFGKPGEPRYEEMIDKLYAALKKGKLSPREKDRQRRLRKLRRQQELENQYGG
jgi:hypothetical protein